MITKAQFERLMQERIEAGKKIDATTAILSCFYTPGLDIYWDGLEMPENAEDGGGLARTNFARAPESDIWVYVGDLPARRRVRL